MSQLENPVVNESALFKEALALITAGKKKIANGKADLIKGIDSAMPYVINDLCNGSSQRINLLLDTLDGMFKKEIVQYFKVIVNFEFIESTKMKKLYATNAQFKNMDCEKIRQSIAATPFSAWLDAQAQAKKDKKVAKILNSAEATKKIKAALSTITKIIIDNGLIEQALFEAIYLVIDDIEKKLK